MHKYYITLLCCLWIERSIAQVDVVDVLTNQLSVNTQNDTSRVNLLNALSYEYQWFDFDRSLSYANEALMLAESLSFQKGIATAYSRQAQSSWFLGDSERAMERALRAVGIAEKEGLTNVLAETYRIMAVCYRDQLDLDKATYYVRMAEKMALHERDWDLLARIYNAAGVIAYSRKLVDSARMYYNTSLQISAEHTTRRFHLSQVISNLGETYLAEDPGKGLSYFVTALKNAKENHNRPSEAGIMGDIGRAYILKKKYGEADRYLKQSLKMSRELGLKRISRYAYYALADLKLKEGNTAEAFNYMTAYYDVRDSLLNAAQTRQIVELETRFEKEKQEQKIELLEQERRIERLWNNVLLVGSILLTITVIVIYRLQQLRSTKAKLLLETQQALNEQLKETDLMKSRFYANISHEFRTPLTLILGQLEAQLKNSNLSLSEEKNLKIVQRNAYRLLDLVNQLLDLSKLESGKMQLSATQGNLTEFLQLITASFDSLAEHKQISFLKYVPVIDHPVGFDKDKIEKIVTNILFNAFKFTPPGGKAGISIHMIKERRELVISVVDTGKGIPDDEQAMIFSPFYQLKYDGEDGNAGTGLGLSLVHELVKLYGGTIKLISELNQGTCITVTLPVFETASVAEVQSTSKNLVENRSLPLADEDGGAPKNELSNEVETILVVEDNVELRTFIASGLGNKFRILLAVDGDHGFAKAKEYIPDVIISDVMMPRMNGLELTQRIRHDERTSHIPIIILTARADDESRLAGLTHGADEYLAKPFLMEELQIRVTNILEQRRRLANRLKDVMLTTTLPEPSEPSLDEKFILRLKSIIEENLSNASLSVEMLADKMNLSRAHLFRKVKALINISPSEFINDLRLQRAAQMIRSRTDNVSQIGYAVGYNEQSYFSKRFRKKFGVSPKDYAKHP